jgi:hypothetical protein
MKNVTVSLPEEALRWLRVRAAEQDMSVSRMLCQMVEAEMSLRPRIEEPEYPGSLPSVESKIPRMALDVENRLTREEAHERR